jgi:hypothetical protein
MRNSLSKDASSEKLASVWRSSFVCSSGSLGEYGGIGSLMEGGDGSSAAWGSGADSSSSRFELLGSSADG